MGEIQSEQCARPNLKSECHLMPTRIWENGGLVHFLRFLCFSFLAALCWSSPSSPLTMSKDQKRTVRRGFAQILIDALRVAV